MQTGTTKSRWKMSGTQRRLEMKLLKALIGDRKKKLLIKN